MTEPEIVVFTDGSSKGNPGPGGWGAVIVTAEGRVVERGGGAPLTTNNKMELTGAIEALAFAASIAGRVTVYTDSTYVLKGIQDWLPNWRRRGWKTAAGGEVMNRDLWEQLSAVATARGPRAIEWRYVRGHVGTPGNERCDEIADAFATGRPVTLFDGPLATYPIPIHDLPSVTQALPRSKTPSAGSKASGPPYSYLSVVDGKPMRHDTWAECERRVKGRSGARFKKAMSAADQAEILRSWQFKPEDV